MDVPDWQTFLDEDFRAPAPDNPHPGDWIHGWQFHACAARDHDFATHVHLPLLDPNYRALRLSQRGPCASRHFTVAPSTPETTFTPEQFRTLLLVRLHLPLQIDSRRCGCGAMLDARGIHRSECARVGVLGVCGVPVEVAAARICREGNARVRENQFVRDMNVVTTPDDTRRIKVIANGLPFFNGKQIAIDTTTRAQL